MDSHCHCIHTFLQTPYCTLLETLTQFLNNVYKNSPISWHYRSSNATLYRIKGRSSIYRLYSTSFIQYSLENHNFWTKTTRVFTITILLNKFPAKVVLFTPTTNREKRRRLLGPLISWTQMDGVLSQRALHWMLSDWMAWILVDLMISLFLQRYELTSWRLCIHNLRDNWRLLLIR